jgi:hypothetical protein
VDYIVDGPHFNPNPPTTTFADPIDSLAGQCGDLLFENRTRSFTSIYASGREEESPWKYWWRRARRANDGIAAALEEVRKVSVPMDSLDTADIPMWLSDQYDGVGAILILQDDATLQISEWGEIAFTEPWLGPGGLNISVQHWAHIDPPVLNSATVNGQNVTLTWTNHNQGRSIDSTNIYRNDIWRRTVGPAFTSFVDSNVAPGIYTYTLKHLSVPAAPLAQAFPNSPASNGLQATVTASATACATAEYLPTWKRADQYLSAGCSQLGPTKRFRWQPAAGAAWTPWTTDTLYDFTGHTQAGAQLVVLQDSNTSTGATSRDTLAFTVSNHQVTLHGPTLIRDKGRKTYWADSAGAGTPHSGQWFERYDDGPRWYVGSAYPQDTLKRIWPYGDYYEDLRQHRVSQGVLHRGRLHVVVCSIPGCEPYAPPARAPGADATDWGLFGVGPWLSWGSAAEPKVLRFYDLWGNPERESVFRDARWIEGPGGQVADAATGWSLSWTPRDLGLTDVRAFDFTVAGPAAQRSVFGLAVDPDLGPNGGDDVASYDAGRGLVVVADAGRAVGFLLRSPTGSGIRSVQEYGVGRWAPVTGEAAWGGQRETGVHIVGQPRDVQLVISAPETLGSGRWLFVVLRGDSPSTVRARADAVLRVVR